MTDRPACPCHAPSAVKLWECDLHLCGRHARDWLRSYEKKVTVQAIKDDDQERADRAISLFIRRVQNEAPWWIKVLDRLGVLR